MTSEILGPEKSDLPPKRGGEHQRGPRSPYFHPSPAEAEYILSLLPIGNPIADGIREKIHHTMTPEMRQMREPGQ